MNDREYRDTLDTLACRPGGVFYCTQLQGKGWVGDRSINRNIKGKPKNPDTLFSSFSTKIWLFKTTIPHPCHWLSLRGSWMMLRMSTPALSPPADTQTSNIFITPAPVSVSPGPVWPRVAHARLMALLWLIWLELIHSASSLLSSLMWQ